VCLCACDGLGGPIMENVSLDNPSSFASSSFCFSFLSWGAELQVCKDGIVQVSDPGFGS